MNKRQKKKRNNKLLTVIADECPLIFMSESEIKEALKEKERFRVSYGYRKKYANLRGNALSYYYPSCGSIPTVTKH